MIKFNIVDYNLKKIRIKSKLDDLQTKYNYKIYGLRQENNPLIIIRHYPYETDGLNDIARFLALNNLEVIRQRDKNVEKNYLYIGLRRDLRTHINLSTCIIQTIVYAKENLIKLTQLKLPGIPKFTKENNVQASSVSTVL